jgi:hypothetical protein
MTRKVPEYHGRDRTDCDCGVCTGEDAYLDSMDRQYQTWLRTLD